MTNYIILDYNKEYDNDKFIIGKEVKSMFDNTHIGSKYYLYYMDEMPKDIYIKLPLIRLIYNYKNIKFNQIKLPIYPSWDKTIKFLSFIKKLELFIKRSITTKSKFTSIIDKSEDIKTLKLSIENTKITSILDNITLQDFKKGGQVEIICKLSNIYDANEKYGININAYQIKYFPSVEELDIDFYDDIPKSKPIIPIIPKIEPIKPALPEQILFCPPSMKDLQIGIKNLKKINY